MALFNIKDRNVKKINIKRFRNEKELQTLFENNLEEIFGVRFLATEFPTTHGGRMDTLGLDDNNAPVIIEFKEGEKDNVINQGLFYLDWLIDHKGDFNVLVQNKLSKNININWDEPRLIIVAQSYNEYDKYAVNRIADNIELWRYTIYEEGVLSVERAVLPKENRKIVEKKQKHIIFEEYSIERHIGDKNESVKALVNRLRDEILKLDDHIVEKIKKHYIAYSLEKNFTEIVVQSKRLWVHIDLPEGFQINDPEKKIKNVSETGHWATGNYKIEVSSFEDIDYCIKIIKQSYENKL